MENNAPENEITEQDEMNGVVTSMNDKLGLSFNVSFRNWCIYEVPEFILKGREYFYQPLMMSIGPVYYQDTKLETMQELKWIFLNCFLQHPHNACRSVNPYIAFVRLWEWVIRSSYQQKSGLSSDEFVEMIVLDAAFLIYFFMASGETAFLFQIPFVAHKLQAQIAYLNHDLLKLENQIPYFVLKGIFDIAFGNIYRPITLINAALTFIGYSGIPGREAIESIIDANLITDESNVKHLVDLQRMCCCLSLSIPLRNQPNTNPTADSDEDSHRLCYTAKQLKDAGVTFVAGETENPLDITFADGKLTISKLRIQDPTEAYLRNLIYFEQCHHFRDSYFSDYNIFLEDLIDSVEDVQVLVKNKIFSKILGSDEEVKNMFDIIGKNTIYNPRSYNYSNVCRDVNRYASLRRNQWMAILRSKYFNHPWAILSVIAALMLFMLTLLQTTAAYLYK